MSPWVDLLRWVHVIGATVLFGTGAGIAFFMLMAQRTGRADIVAHVAGTVVIADTMFTATAVIVQPISGVLLAQAMGWPLSEGWIVLSLLLYVVTGLFWLPVVWIQIRIRNLARQAAIENRPLPAEEKRLFRIWFACCFPAFAAVLAILWLMVTRPEIGF
ncbi:membrane protein [Mesorhizobium amorphae CCBAU 01583]|nr:membrane protein [Mesorhizobium amorphae CCBAU 01583]